MQLKLTVSVLALCTFSPIAFTNEILTFNSPYIGVEAIRNNQNFKPGFGGKLFVQHTTSYNAFAGFKFTENFGFEFGYEFQPRRTKDSILFGPQQYIGQTLNADESIAIQSSYKLNHRYIGVFGDYSSAFNVGSDKLKFQVFVGASESKLKARTTISIVNGFVSNSSKNYSKAKIIPMLKVSALANLQRNVSLRLSVTYRATSGLRASSLETTQSPYIVKMKDSVSIGLGIICRL